MARTPKHASRLYTMPNMRSYLGLGLRACPKGRSWPLSHSKGKGCQRCKVVGARQSVKRPSTSHGLVSSRWSPRISSHYFTPIGSSPAPQPAASNGDATATDFRDSQEPTDAAQHSRWPGQQKLISEKRGFRGAGLNLQSCHQYRCDKHRQTSHHHEQHTPSYSGHTSHFEVDKPELHFGLEPTRIACPHYD